MVASTGDVIYIGADLPNEYSGSKYTHSLKGTNAKAKANATQGIPEMIEIALGKYYRENKESKHWRNAMYGWYRYDSRFAIPVYRDDEEVERYNIFHASLIVRYSEDGKLYLYDVIDIKKRNEQKKCQAKKFAKHCSGWLCVIWLGITSSRLTLLPRRKEKIGTTCWCIVCCIVCRFIWRLGLTGNFSCCLAPIS